MAGVNRVMLIGNLGADAELRYAQSGGAIMNLRLAVNETWKDQAGERKERTEWCTVVMFGTRAEALAKHLTKGQQVFVEGRLQTRQWEDKEGNKRSTTEIVATNLEFLGGGKRDDGARREAPRPQHRTTRASEVNEPDDFDIPF